MQVFAMATGMYSPQKCLWHKNSGERRTSKSSSKVRALSIRHSMYQTQILTGKKPRVSLRIGSGLRIFFGIAQGLENRGLPCPRELWRKGSSRNGSRNGGSIPRTRTGAESSVFFGGRSRPILVQLYISKSFEDKDDFQVEIFNSSSEHWTRLLGGPLYRMTKRRRPCCGLWGCPGWSELAPQIGVSNEICFKMHVETVSLWRFQMEISISSG